MLSLHVSLWAPLRRRAALGLLLTALITLFSALTAMACRNMELNVGVIDTPEGRVFAQMISTFIHERTAVKTGMYFFPSREELEAALGAKRVQIIVFDVRDALAAMGETPSADADVDYQKVKAWYRREHRFLVLEPFAFSTAGTGPRVPVIREQILQKFPALPRVLAKLTRSIGDEARDELLGAIAGGGEGDLAKMTEEFLLRRRLI